MKVSRKAGGAPRGQQTTGQGIGSAVQIRFARHMRPMINGSRTKRRAGMDEKARHGEDHGETESLMYRTGLSKSHDFENLTCFVCMALMYGSIVVFNGLTR